MGVAREGADVGNGIEDGIGDGIGRPRGAGPDGNDGGPSMGGATGSGPEGTPRGPGSVVRAEPHRVQNAVPSRRGLPHEVQNPGAALAIVIVVPPTSAGPSPRVIL
jgi:hypothetical protein